jgi:hypothetical protein
MDVDPFFSLSHSLLAHDPLFHELFSVSLSTAFIFNMLLVAKKNAIESFCFFFCIDFVFYFFFGVYPFPSLPASQQQKRAKSDSESAFNDDIFLLFLRGAKLTLIGRLLRTCNTQFFLNIS